MAWHRVVRLKRRVRVFFGKRNGHHELMALKGRFPAGDPQTRIGECRQMVIPYRVGRDRASPRFFLDPLHAIGPEIHRGDLGGFFRIASVAGAVRWYWATAEIGRAPAVQIAAATSAAASKAGYAAGFSSDFVHYHFDKSPGLFECRASGIAPDDGFRVRKPDINQP